MLETADLNIDVREDSKDQEGRIKRNRAISLKRNIEELSEEFNVSLHKLFQKKMLTEGLILRIELQMAIIDKKRTTLDFKEQEIEAAR